MEVDRVTGPRIPAPGDQGAVDDLGIGDQSALVSPAELVELGVAHDDVLVVHEHDVAPLRDRDGAGVLGGESDVPGVVGHVDVQAEARRGPVVPDQGGPAIVGTVGPVDEGDPVAGDAGDLQDLVLEPGVVGV